ncbi:MAG TPA: efflux RND transporter periplasmic adaptor subunit [Polyangiaceae bacterium]|nr:efflux RND transporter periplasmic adaptor subunit [Polyangiaceae bacterium]
MHERHVAHSVRVGAWFALCALGTFAASLLTTGCSKGIEHEAHAQAGGARPQVTVAQVTQATITEFSEHTGHTEAPSTVEIRARATGYLTRAAFHEGDLVKKGELLFEVDERPYRASLARARAELESARVDAELARKNATRGEQLFRANVISEQEWDTRGATFHQLAARTQVASAAVNSAELDLDYTSVRSPIAGRIGRFLVTPGNLVGPSLATPLTTVVSVDPLYVYVDVDETRALRLGRTPGAVARVGFSGEDGFPHEAALDFVDNRVDPQTGTIKVRAVLKNPDGHWVHGLFARVQLPEQTSHEALLIADLAVATDQDRRFVWVVAEDGKVEHRTVTLGPLNGGLRIVREGLTGKERIVVRGLQRVRPGALVAAQTVSMRDAAELDKLAEVKP